MRGGGKKGWVQGWTVSPKLQTLGFSDLPSIVSLIPTLVHKRLTADHTQWWGL